MWIGSKDTFVTPTHKMEQEEVKVPCKYATMIRRVKALSSLDVRRIFAILHDLQHLEAVELQDYYLLDFGFTVGEFCTCYVLRDYVPN